MIDRLYDNATRAICAQYGRIIGKTSFRINHDPCGIWAVAEPYSQPRTIVQRCSDTDDDPVHKRAHPVQMHKAIRSRYIARIA